MRSRCVVLAVLVVIAALVGPHAPAQEVGDVPGAAARERSVRAQSVSSMPVAGASARRGVAPPRPVHVVRLLPRGARPDAAVSPAAARRMVAGASAYWSEQTRGSVSFRVASVSSWRRTTATCHDIDGLWEDALSRVPAAAGRAHHLVVVLPATHAQDPCLYGFGSMGVADSGGSTYVSALQASLLAHELGHNLGLGHAGSLVCARTQDGRRTSTGWAAGCTHRAYDDLFDVMGYSGEGFGEGNLGAVHIDQLGADPAGVRVLTSTGRVVLAPLSARSGTRVLKIAVRGEPLYYAEYRTATGRDAAPAAGAWRPSVGVRILRVDPDDGGSLELDASPGSGRTYDRALRPGRTFVTASGRVRITVRSAAAARAVLDVVVSPATRARTVGGPRT